MSAILEDCDTRKILSICFELISIDRMTKNRCCNNCYSLLGNDSHKDGLVAFFGLNISKIITSIFGGMVTTDDSKFAVKVRKVREEMFVDG